MSVQRIALISPYALSVYGGAQEQALAMSRVLSSRGRDVLIVAPDDSDDTNYDTPAKVLRLGMRLSLPANGSRAPLTLSPIASSRTRAAVDAFRADVVHFHEPFAPLLGWSTLWAHQRGAVGTFHRSGDGPALTFSKPLLERLATRVDVAVSVSDAAARTLLQACGLRSEVLFNGFEVDRFVASPRQRSSTPVLFYVGRLEERKGVGVAINAAKAHNTRGEGAWRLVIAGGGPDRGRLESLARSDSAIEFLGRVSEEEKRSWLRRVDVLVAPSTHGESFGTVLLEGMASETLVVASDIEGYREAAGGHATLFAAGSASSLEDAIQRALEGESDADLAAARAYAEGWSMARLVDAYEERYEVAQRYFQATQ
ncbi:MAG: glycosyltransferase family 4 protein [Acidimicrobiales bacterium]